MHWVYSTFKNYCESKGYLLLHDDLKFIATIVRCIPEHKQKHLLLEYCNVWKNAMNNERDSNRRQSAGRREANNFLLKHQEKEIK